MSAASSRQAFFDLCESFDLDPIIEENAILSCGREYLPACALVVLDSGVGGPLPGSGWDTEEYWEWLAIQTQAAQDEWLAIQTQAAQDDAEYARDIEALARGYRTGES